MFLKIKIICKEENYGKYRQMLEKSGFTISKDATLLFKEEDFIQDSFIGEQDGEFEIVHFSKIIFIESFGRDIVLHTQNKEYSIREKLFEIEGILAERGFIRINKSTIVSKPTFNGRIDLQMKNNKKVSVSKNYNKKFRSYIGF